MNRNIGHRLIHTDYQAFVIMTDTVLDLLLCIVYDLWGWIIWDSVLGSKYPYKTAFFPPVESYPTMDIAILLTCCFAELTFKRAYSYLCKARINL